MKLIKILSALVLLSFLTYSKDLSIEFTSENLKTGSHLPLRITFSEPMIPFGYLQNSVPDGLLIMPQVSGKWSWCSQNTLQFTPDAPWRNGYRYQVTIPRGTTSKISGNQLKRTFTQDFLSSPLSGYFVVKDTLILTTDYVTASFSQPVHPDSLRKHLSGANVLELKESDNIHFQIRPKSGWPQGKRITLTIDTGLKPIDGNMPLESPLMISFIASDSLICLGLFCNDVKVSSYDSLFLEDNYSLRFNRPLHDRAISDYSEVNNQPFKPWLPNRNQIDLNNLFSSTNICTLSFSAGMPSVDSAFLFNNLKFILKGGYNRIDPALPAFSINDVSVKYDRYDSLPVIKLSARKSIPLTPSLRFEFSINKKNSTSKFSSGQIYCRTPEGIDTLRVWGDSIPYIDHLNLPENAACTLIVKAGYRLAGYQLKKDFIVFFTTDKYRYPNICRSLISKYDDYEFWLNNQDYPQYLILPEAAAIPLEIYGKQQVITAIRNIPVLETLHTGDSTRTFQYRWHYDTIPCPKQKTDWYTYVPVPLSPVLSNNGRGCAEVLLSVDNNLFDTLGKAMVTDLGLQLLYGRLVTAAAVTSLTNKDPVHNAEVTFYDEDLHVLSTGQTDTLGLYQVPHSKPVTFVSVAVPGDTLVYQIQDNYSYYSAVNKGVLFTDRSLYRPEDTIFFKGIIRQLYDRWTPVTNDSAIVRVEWEGTNPFADTIPLVGCGSFSGKIAIPYDAEQKKYTVTATMLHTSCQIAGGDFSITEFRTAELTGTIKNGFVYGDSVFFPVSARWLHGGMAGGCPLKLNWNMTRYEFQGSEGFTWNHDYDSNINIKDTAAAILDSNGTLVIGRKRIDADSGVTYTLSASISGSPVQSVHAQGWVVIPRNHRLHIGFLFRYDEYQNDSAMLLFNSMYENSEIAKDKKLHVSIYQHKNIKKQQKNRFGLPAFIHDTLMIHLPSHNIITDSLGIGQISAKMLPAGTYTAKVTAATSPESDTFTYVFTKEAPRIHSDNFDRSEENSDDTKDTFSIEEISPCIHNPGDTVRIKLHAMQDSCAVALTVTRDNLYEYRWLKMSGKDTIITFTVKDNYIPAVLIGGSFFPPLWRNSKGFTFNQPKGVHTAFTTVKISDASRHIPLQLSTDKETYSPGDSVTVNITIPSGFSSSSALLMVVDEGVLRLSNSQPAEIEDIFAIDTGDFSHLIKEYSFKKIYGPFNYDSCNALHLRPQRDGQGGIAGVNYSAGYGYGFDDCSQSVVDLYGGLIGGEENSLFFSKRNGIRNPPRSCAYFNPSVKFDSTGKAMCSFMLPGNLTRWRITSIVDDTTAFGSDYLSFESNKPLMVRPQIPRFLRTGDSASAAYIIENRSTNALRIKTGTIFTCNTSVDTFTLNSKSSYMCHFPLIGRLRGYDSLLLLASSDSLADGITLGLPVISEQVREIQAIGGSTVDSITIPLILPAKSDIKACTLGLSLSTTRMQNLREGIRYLFDYPYGCLEQQSSKIMPLLMLNNFTRQFQLPMLKNGDEKSVIQTYLDHIKDFQNTSDGGLTYWPSDSGYSYPWLTAYVLEIMIKAKAAGFSIDTIVYTRALDFLTQNNQKNDSDYRDLIVDSYKLLIMTQAGKPDYMSMMKLLKLKNKLPVTARIYLLKALYAAGGKKRVISFLQKSLQQSLIEKDRLAYFTQDKSQGLNFCHESPVRQTALCLEALLETGSKSRYDEPMIRWLTAQRQSGRWRTTQENMAVFRAFAAYTNVYEHDEPKLNAAISLGGSDWFTTVLQGREGASTHRERQLDSIPENETSVHINRIGSGRLYYDISLTKQLSDTIPAVSTGLTVTRNIEYFQPNVSNGYELSIGSCVTVELVVRCDQDITFAVVEDPIPAGCEAVNPDLQSGEQYMAQQITSCYGPASPTHREFRDSRVLFFFNEMPAGEYRIQYLLKPVTEGRFVWPAPHAESMYYPEIFGRGNGTVARIYK